MSINVEDRVDGILSGLAAEHWDRPAEVARAAYLRERALQRRPILTRRNVGMGLLAAGALTGLGFAAAAILHSFPLNMEIESDGQQIYSGDLEATVENGVIKPIVVQTENGPLEIPIHLPPNIDPESVIGMKMKVKMETKYPPEEKPEEKK